MVSIVSEFSHSVCKCSYGRRAFFFCCCAASLKKSSSAYRKLPLISPRLIQLCKGFWVGLWTAEWFSYIHNFIIILSRVYKEPIFQLPAPSWLVTLIARALDRYPRGQGFESRTSLNLYRLSFRNCKRCVYNCDDILSYNSSLHSSHIWFSYIHNFTIEQYYLEVLFIDSKLLQLTAGMRREILALTERFLQLMSLKQGKVCPLFRLTWLAFFLIMCITCRDVSTLNYRILNKNYKSAAI